MRTSNLVHFQDMFVHKANPIQGKTPETIESIFLSQIENITSSQFI